MATFSGAWMRGAYTDPDEYERHEIDARHTEEQAPGDELTATTYQTPPQADAGIAGEYVGLDWVTMTPGRIVDHSDQRSHERDDADHGAAVAGAFNERATAFSDEQYTHERYEMDVSSEVSTVALQRGLNGLDVNNPEGYRAGWHWPTWANRRFPIGERVHDERVLLPNTAYVEGESPPQEGGQYPVPFGSLAQAITTIAQRPQARREPPPMYAEEISEPPYEPAVTGMDWVL